MDRAQILAVGDTDSRLKWTLSIANKFFGHRAKHVQFSTYNLLNQHKDEDLITYVPDLSNRFVNLSKENIAQHYQALLRFDVIVCCFVASEITAFIHAINKLHQQHGTTKRPIIVTGYCGLVYEKRLEGVVYRLGADVICVNSLADMEQFQPLLRELPEVQKASFIVTGLLNWQVPEKFSCHKKKKILFATQQMVPKQRREREYILLKLAQYAAMNPDVEVLIKPRARPGVNSTHPERFYYHDIFDENNLSVIPNLKITYGYMPDLLKECSLCLTISSTAAIEALSYGCRAGIISDLGIKEGFGNHIFLGSDMLMSLDDLDDEAKWPKPNVNWLRHNGINYKEGWNDLEERLLVLLGQRSTTGLPILAQKMLNKVDLDEDRFELKIELRKRYGSICPKFRAVQRMRTYVRKKTNRIFS